MAQHRVFVSVGRVIVRERLNPFRVSCTRVSEAAIEEIVRFFEFVRVYQHALGVFTQEVTERVVHTICQPIVEGRADLRGLPTAMRGIGTPGVALELRPGGTIQRFDSEGIHHSYQAPTAVLLDGHHLLAKLWVESDALQAMVEVDVSDINLCLFDIKVQGFVDCSEHLAVDREPISALGA